jgi:hypothetical protein
MLALSKSRICLHFFLNPKKVSLNFSNRKSLIRNPHIVTNPKHFELAGF